MNTQAQGKSTRPAEWHRWSTPDQRLPTRTPNRNRNQELIGGSLRLLTPSRKKYEHIHSHPTLPLRLNAPMTKAAAKRIHQLPHSTPANSTPNTTSEPVLGTPAFIHAELEVDTCAIAAYVDPHALFSVFAAVLYVCVRPPRLEPLVLLSAPAYDAISPDVHSLHALVVIFGPSGWPSGNW